MNSYYDTGIVLKLYTTERESPAVRRFVTARKEPLFLSSLHRAECVSAFRLKVFRGECAPEAAASALADIEDDFLSGVLRPLPIDWDGVWTACRAIADAHAAETGCRTLDTLHVACARIHGVREFITHDQRQTALAKRLGMRVASP